jgi:WD40 repeat protein
MQRWQGHQAGIGSLAVTPDGKRLVSSSYDHTVKVWDLESSGELLTLRGHQAQVDEVVLSGDGRRAISASRDKTLKVWNLGTGKTLFTLRGHKDRIWAVALTPDGSCAVSVSQDHTLKVWDLGQGEEVASFNAEGALKVCAVTADGKTIVAGEQSGKVHILRFQGNKAAASALSSTDPMPDSPAREISGRSRARQKGTDDPSGHGHVRDLVMRGLRDYVRNVSDSHPADDSKPSSEEIESGCEEKDSKEEGSSSIGSQG